MSDVGILQLSNSCPSLELLHLARSELAFKITDVAMLGLGERCRQLTDLDVSGCSFLTDAGLEWLAGGCNQLMTLKLRGLYKLTDTCACADRAATVCRAPPLPYRACRGRFL